MITNLYLDNFMCFEDTNFSFLEKNNTPVKFAFIYGENGAGKTNIIQAFNFLNILYTNKKLIQDYENINHLNDAKVFSLDNLLTRHKKVNSNGKLMTIKVSYLFDNKRSIYEIRFDDKNIVYEELKYEKNKYLSTVFKIEKDKKFIDDKFIFIDEEFKKENIYLLNKYFGNYTFICLFLDSLKNTNEDFINKAVNKEFFELIKNIIGIFVDTNSDDDTLVQTKISETILRGQIVGDIDESKRKLNKEEEMLTLFFGSLYSKILKLIYKYKFVNNKWFYELHVIEKDGDKTIEVPFDFVSAGTKRIMKLYMEMKSLLLGKTIIIDEIDTGIHDLLIRDIVQQLVEYGSDHEIGQLIATTHNTYIMHELNPKNIYILNEDNVGNKEFYRISEFRNYVQKNNNYERKYHDGAYGGIPYSFFSLDAFASDVLEGINE